MQFEDGGDVHVGAGEGEDGGRVTVDELTSFSDAYVVASVQMRRLICAVDQRDGELYAMLVV